LSNTVDPPHIWDTLAYTEKGQVTPEDVVLAVAKGLRRGQKDFGVVGRQILCCLRSHPGYSPEVLHLCVKYFKNSEVGVVGIDFAGCAHDMDNFEKYDDVTIQVFREAQRIGIHRTVHAGEAGSSEDVRSAILLTHAERIGHGYQVLRNEDLYEELRKLNIHFETCPISSYATGSISCDHADHPTVRFANDGANFSLSTDDPTWFCNSIETELKFARSKLGLTELQIAQSQINAAKSCFLPDDEKAKLVNHVKNAYQLVL